MHRARHTWPKLTLPIETPRLLLRLPTLGDVPDLRGSFRDRRTATAVGAPLHSLEERRDPAKMVRRTRAEFRRATDLSLSVILRTDGRCVGRVGLRGIDWNYRTVESLSYWIDPRFWGQGYATEASWFLCHVAFTSLGIRRISSSALEPNVASIRVMRKLGFEAEGRQRQAIRLRGRSMDMRLYGLLRTELMPWRTLARPGPATARTPRLRPAEPETGS
jgi:[ribosomal protein S5]-alanine N-acetyltransferase